MSFTPSPDVVAILNALLDKFENRPKRSTMVGEAEGLYRASPSIKILLDNLDLPSYFSQTDPEPRIIANQQLQTLEQRGFLRLKWLPGETNHLLYSVSLPVELQSERSQRDETHNPEKGSQVNKSTLKQENVAAIPGDTNNLELAPVPDGKVSGKTWNLTATSHSTQHQSLYQLLKRTPLSNHRARLESLLLAEKFRYPKEDWRARALNTILGQLQAGKSPSPFSLSDSDLNLDLLAVLQALPTLRTETPYRVFSVRLFNDTKRFDDLKFPLVRLARRAHREWKSFNNDDLLREFNLVANPGYVLLSGNWELTDNNGQIINFDSFHPSVGFPASQITSLQKITIRAESVICIENLTSFHQYTHGTEFKPRDTEQVNRYTGTQVHNGTYNTALQSPGDLLRNVVEGTSHATICLMGNPSPAIRHLLHLIPEDKSIYLWSDIDYGGFNILSQLRRQVSPRIQPYLMDIATFDRHAHLSRPLTQSDIHNLKRLTLNPALSDVHATLHHLLKRGLKLEQEAIEI